MTGYKNKNIVDIDLFFFGDIEEQKNTIVKIIDMLSEKYTVKLVDVNGVKSLYIKELLLIFQFISTKEKNPENIINDFDVSYVKSYYDGEKVYSTDDCIKSMETQTTKVYYYRKLLRLYKILTRKLDILYEDHPVFLGRNLPLFSRLDYKELLQNDAIKKYINQSTKEYFMNQFVLQDDEEKKIKTLYNLNNIPYNTFSNFDFKEIGNEYKDSIGNIHQCFGIGNCYEINILIENAYCIKDKNINTTKIYIENNNKIYPVLKELYNSITKLLKLKNINIPEPKKISR